MTINHSCLAFAFGFIKAPVGLAATKSFSIAVSFRLFVSTKSLFSSPSQVNNFGCHGVIPATARVHHLPRKTCAGVMTRSACLAKMDDLLPAMQAGMKGILAEKDAARGDLEIELIDAGG